MSDLTLFYLESCPYCKRARGYMQELCDENPSYADIPVQMVEETQQRELAGSYDYFYVPCFYIDKEKVSEGAVDKEGVRAVFDRYLEEKDEG